MEYQRKIWKNSLTFYTILGLHPYKKLEKIKIFSFILVMMILLGLVFLRFCYEDISFQLISDTFESTFTILHVLSKFLTLAVAQPALKKILDTTDTFIYFKFHPQFEKKVCEALKTLLFLLRTFLIYIILAIISFGIRPIFNDSLAISCYIPEFIPRSLFSFFNSAIFGICAFAVGSFDMFVCAAVVLTAIQFKILNYIISSFKLEDVRSELELKRVLRKMKICIDHHNFLNSFLLDVSLVVGPAILVYFTLAPMTLCFELFFISKSNNCSEIAKSIVYFGGIAIELFFFFCLPATYLMIQSEKAINVVYNTGWESCYFLSIRKPIVIMMQRMQKQTVLKAGKMVKINLETCTNAFQMALSFYTSLQILDDKTKQRWE